MDGGAWWAAVHGVAKSQTRLSNFTFTFHFHALEKEMATHSSVLAWRISGTGEPGGLPSMGSHRVGHDWSDLVAGDGERQGSLVCCSPWGREKSDTTEQVHFHFSVSCIGEGNGNPLQCSCLENPRDGGARWAAVYGVVQSRTWLKWLSSSRQIL